MTGSLALVQKSARSQPSKAVTETSSAKAPKSVGQPEMLRSDFAEGDTFPCSLFEGTAVHFQGLDARSSGISEFESPTSEDGKVTPYDIVSEDTSSVASFPSSFGNTSTATEETLPPPYWVEESIPLQKSSTFPFSHYDGGCASIARDISLAKGTHCSLNML